MTNNNNTYNQPPRGQMMPPQIPPQAPPRPRGWREKWMTRFGMNVATAPLGKGERTIPHWLTGKSMVFFFVAMLACWEAFGYVPTFDLALVTSISVVLFFYGGYSISKGYAHSNSKRFIWIIFCIGVAVRFVWILYMYFVFNPAHYGNTFGDTADVDWYMPFGQAIAQWISDGFTVSINELRTTWGSSIDDIGYPFWLGIIYLLTENVSDVFIPMVFKCIFSAYCTISIYRVAKRHYGEGTARMAAIFVALNPNMIYWCASMMKESEMVFLCCVAIDNFDRVLSSGKRYTFRALLPGILAGITLLFFRTALALVLFLALFAHIVMVSHRVMSMGKKIIAALLVGSVLMIGFGDRIRTQSRELIEAVQSDRQEKNMEFRSTRMDGNAFAKYAGAAVFAPLIFTIPFPTFNDALEYQNTQKILAGGSYIKNIFSFFVILVMIMMLISGEWRHHVFIIAYTVGYHLVLVMSSFAQSGRFHMPVIPMLMLFAAYGIQIAKTNKRVRKWFPLVLVIELFVCLAWNWFKLAGRGMI